MICVCCQIRYVIKPFSDYSENICWFCWLKTHKKYAAAAKLLGYSKHSKFQKQTTWEYKTALGKPQNGFFNWSTGLLEKKIGWSFWENAMFSLLLANILNHPGLNKHCKVPELTQGFRKDGWPKQLSHFDSLIKLGYSEWAAKTVMEYLAE